MLACTCPCNDNNPCTADSCDPVLGCIYTLLTVRQWLFFFLGGAWPTPPPQCDDGDPCTVDPACNSTYPNGCPQGPRVRIC